MENYACTLTNSIEHSHFEKPIYAQLVNKLLAFNGTWSFITVLTKARQM